MTVKEFYEKTENDYQGVMSRLLTEERILKYLRRIDAQGDYRDAIAALEAGDWNLAFRATHSLKGICLNLGLTKLFEPTSELCESLRHDSEDTSWQPEVDWRPLADNMTAAYINHIQLIEELEG